MEDNNQKELKKIKINLMNKI